MKRRAFLAATAAALVVPRDPHAAAADAVSRPPDADVTARCDAYLTALARLGRFSGTAAVQFGDRTVLRGAYGMADLAHSVPCEPGTQFEAASISKMFTAYAALVLRDRAALRLDEPIASYLDDCPPHWRPVTVAHLMHHASGIPDYEDALGLESAAYLDFMREPNSSQRILARQKPLPLDFPPGSKYHYSNTGYIVLATIVERAARIPFGAFLRREIFDPAAMRDTGTFGYDTPARLATGYRDRTIPWPAYLAGFRLADFADPLPQLPLTPPHGDAGVYTTASDLARWNAIMQGHGFVSAALRAEIFDGGAFGYGAGWEVGDADGYRRFRHTGELPGFLGVTAIYPDDGLSIVLLTNWMRTRVNLVASALRRIVSGKPNDMPISGTVVALTAAQRDALVGRYRTESGRVMTVTPDPLGLQAKIPDSFTAGLIPLSATRFYFVLADGTMTFALGPDGRATSVDMRYAGADHVAVRIAEGA